MRLRFLLPPLALIMLLVILPLGAAGWIVYTPAGLQFLATHLPHRIARTTIDIGPVRGTLADGLELDRFTLEHERVSLVVEHVRGRIAVLPLLWQTIDVRDASIGNVVVAIHRRVTPPSGTPLHFLPRLLAIRTDAARIVAARIVLINGRILELSNISGSGYLHPTRISVYGASADLGELHGGGSLELGAADPIRLEANTRWTWQVPGQPLWTIEASGRGDLDRLAITGAFTTPLRAELSGEMRALTGNWTWSGVAQLRDLDLRAWNAGNLLGRITATLRLAGDAHGFTASGPVESAALAAGPFDLAFDGDYANRVVSAKRLELTHRGSGARLEARGAIGIVHDGPSLDFRGTWRGFRWPLTGSAIAMRSSEGTFQVGGTWPYAITASGPVSVAALEAAVPVRVRGELAKSGFRTLDGEAQLLGGTATFTSGVAWSPRAQWSVAGRMRGFDPSSLRRDFPGRLDFGFEAHGDAFRADSDLDFAVNDLAGRLRGAAASGKGRVLRRLGEWQFIGVQAQSGKLRVALDGRLGRERDLRFDLAADDLAILAPESRGSIRARGQLLGTADQLLVKFVGQGHDIRHEGVSIANFSADVDFDPRATHDSHVKAHAEGLGFGGRTIDQLDAVLGGTPAQYSLEASARAASLRVALKAAGPLQGDGWHGVVSALTIDDGELIALRLDAPASLTTSRSLVRADRLCVHDTNARLCGDAAWNAGRWGASIDAEHLPMTTLTAGLTPNLKYEGTLNIIGRAFGDGAAPWQGNLRADLSEAGIRHRRPNGREDVIALGSGLLTAEATPDALRAKFDLDAHAKGNMRGTVTVQRLPGPWSGMPLRGDLKAATDAIGFATLWIPDIDRAAGRIDTDLVFGGTLGAPVLSGILKLTGGELDLYQINLALRQVSIEARFLDNRLDLDAQAHAGTGSAQVSGSIAWRDAAARGSLHLTGKQLHVVDVPEASIFASPDLTFSLDGRNIDVKGTVVVPEARIVPADLTGAVLPSGDEVLVGAEPPNPAEQFVVKSGITLSLGDHVSIDTSGLTGRLTGNLTTITDADNVSRGRGELSVEEGKYTAYGRKLDIERGRLLFTGGPLGDPGVDIRAVKQFPDIRAGVNVRGTLRAPRLTFFSDPAIPQAQIVSLILAGGSLESLQVAGGSTAGQNQNAARNEILAQGGAILAQQLGSKIGIESGIETDLANDTSLVLGKYLSPRFYVSYGVSLTESLSTLKTRYTLGDHWTIRTEAGKVSSADLVYTIEK